MMLDEAVLLDPALDPRREVFADLKEGVQVAGVPAKVLRELTEQERKWKVIGTDCYQNLARRSLASLKPCAPRTRKA